MKKFVLLLFLALAICFVVSGCAKSSQVNAEVQEVRVLPDTVDDQNGHKVQYLRYYVVVRYEDLTDQFEIDFTEANLWPVGKKVLVTLTEYTDNNGKVTAREIDY